MSTIRKQSTAGELLHFSLPLILGGILQQLYSWVDAFIVGHAEGDLQLGAIGATNVATSLFIHMILGFTLGLSILAAQEFGRGNREKIRRILHTFLPLMGLLCTLLAGVSIVAAKAFLHLLATPDEIFGYSLSYLRIALLGMPLLAVYNTYAAILRAMGNTKVAFYAILISAAFNFVLDMLLVVVLPYGVEGAAAATVIAQLTMALFIVFYTRRKYPDLVRSSGFDRAAFSEGLSFGLPPMVQNSITSLGTLVLQNFMNGFGAVTVLAITTAYRVDTMLLLPVFNLAAAISNLIARSKGAGEGEKITKYLKSGLALMLAVTLVLTLLVYLLGAEFIAIFGVGGEAVLIGRQFFRDLAIFYMLFGTAQALRGALEGIGDITYCSAIGILTLGLRILFSYLLKAGMDQRAIAFAEGYSWICMLLLFVLRVAQKRREFGLGQTKE